jgi:beta-lactamase superfamily II metal-dependent hydrolase
VTTRSTIDGPALEVHVLGAGKGESIVLKMPDDQWGVVDCYASSTTDAATNPTVRFLRDRGVQDLRFVCMTHPHVDHFLGMVQLIDEFRPREFWRASCLSPEHVKLIARYYKICAVVTGLETFSQSAKELLGIYRRVREGVASRELRVLRVSSRMTLIPAPNELGSFRIDCIAPSGNQVELYESAIWRCVGPDGQIIEKLTRSQHNNISLVLRITHGESKILLGGDLEKEGWAQVIGEYGGEQLNASAVKVSHHGSPNGYCDGLWELFAARVKPVAVIAPSRSHRLPKPDAVRHISKHANSIYATCQTSGFAGDAGTRTVEPPPITSRLAMRTAFSTVSAADDGAKCGRCTLRFDELGGYQIEVHHPAQLLRVQ